MKHTTKNLLIIGLIIILSTMSTGPILAYENTIDTSPQKIGTDSGNILANMSVTWDSFLHAFSLKGLQPKVVINQSVIRDFYFPEVNGTMKNLNFTVVCRHKLENTVFIPRFTRVYLAILYNNSYIFLHESANQRCKSLAWEYINFTVDSKNQLDNLTTNGKNATLTVVVGVFGFPFGFQGVTETLEAITVHPIPTRS